MRVYEVMTRDVQTVRPAVRASEAKTRMRQKKIHHLVVVRGGELIGVVSERDLGGSKLQQALGQRTVEELMATPVVTVQPKTPVRRAASLMKGRSIGSLVVTSPSGRVAGIVTVSDLLNVLARQHARQIFKEYRRKTGRERAR